MSNTEGSSGYFGKQILGLNLGFYHKWENHILTNIKVCPFVTYISYQGVGNGLNLVLQKTKIPIDTMDRLLSLSLNDNECILFFLLFLTLSLRLLA